MSGFQFTRPNSFPPVVKNLIIINALIFFADLMLTGVNLNQRLALYSTVSTYHAPYQYVTYMFAHDGFSHLLFNMLGLWIFGARLENIWGAQRFLGFYLVCGLMSGVADQLINFFLLTQSVDPEVDMIFAQMRAMLGASGAVMGVMVAYAYLFPNTELMLMFPPIPIKAKWLIAFTIAADLFGAISPAQDKIAHIAHLGGALAGFIIVFIWNRSNRRRFY